jgi:hypothetical protein
MYSYADAGVAHAELLLVEGFNRKGSRPATNLAEVPTTASREGMRFGDLS